MTKDTPDGRLLSCAGLVRAGGVLADIGTDHAYLPIFLLRTGKIRRAVLSDVNAGPLASARENVKEAGLSALCELVLTDGAEALGGRGITDYAICGMGGELIARIVKDAPDMKREGVRLILQPMSRRGQLRRTLYEEGFSIIEERYSFADGKYYVAFAAEYTGECKMPSDVDLELGAHTPHPCDEKEYFYFLNNLRRAYLGVISGKRSGGESTEWEERVVGEIDRRLEGMNYKGE